ncbi:MAG: hypothetical protein M1833_002606 [Piccolia ochrophora]|nr:MAG: hypothetical protein M1833_002606 [Piccolia ochrophora]
MRGILTFAGFALLLREVLGGVAFSGCLGCAGGPNVIPFTDSNQGTPLLYTSREAQRLPHFGRADPTVKLSAPRTVYSLCLVDPSMTAVQRDSSVPNSKAFPYLFFPAAEDEPAMLLGFNEYFGPQTKLPTNRLTIRIFPSAANAHYTPPRIGPTYSEPDVEQQALPAWNTDKPNSYFFNPTNNGEGAYPAFIQAWLSHRKGRETPRGDALTLFASRFMTHDQSLWADGEYLNFWAPREARMYDMAKPTEGNLVKVTMAEYSIIWSDLAQGTRARRKSQTVLFPVNPKKQRHIDRALFPSSRRSSS